MIQNISFIVIARNESFAIEKCLASIASMPLTECEVICVDSDSTDKTLDVMKGYIGKIQNYRIIQCSGYLNSAVARNAGLRYATKQYIFFVDGDVELSEQFVHRAMEYLLSGKADMVTGQLSEIYYEPDYQNEIKRIEDRYHIRKEKRTLYCSGGIFIARSSIVHKAGSWDERMVRNQDIDYTLRLSRHGRFIDLPLVMGTHHTLSYNERPWLHFKKSYPMYFGMLIRKNLDQPKALLPLLRRNRGFLAGFLVYGLFIVGILSTAFLSLPFLYVALAGSFIVISDLFWGAMRNKNVLNCFLLHYLYVPLIVVGIFVSINNKRPPITVKQISLS